MARDSEPRYAPYPAEIKSAAMVKSYDKLTFQEQVMADDQRETLEMIAHKAGRILNGDSDYHDSWQKRRILCVCGTDR